MAKSCINVSSEINSLLKFQRVLQLSSSEVLENQSCPQALAQHATLRPVCVIQCVLHLEKISKFHFKPALVIYRIALRGAISY